MGSEAPAGLVAARQRWIKAANAADPDAYADVLHEHAVWLPPGMEAIEGREEIRAWLAGAMEGVDYELTLDEVELRPAGSWATETGQFESRMTDQATGQAMAHGGGYMILWREQEDGSWRIDRYVDRTESLTP